MLSPSQTQKQQRIENLLSDGLSVESIALMVGVSVRYVNHFVNSKSNKPMKTYSKKGLEYFYDKYQKLWVLYPINDSGERIEWDENDNPIEAQYFNNKTELNSFLNPKKPQK